ncbi:MAG: hypothetical protein ACXAB7_15160 [Candidatus Kariarchaeaceae archaeon]
MSSVFTKLVALVLLISLTSNIPVGQSLDTDPLEASNQLNLPINIQLQFWGYNFPLIDLIDPLSLHLPQNINHETLSPKNDTPTQYKSLIENELYDYKSPIEYNYEVSSWGALASTYLVEDLNDTNGIENNTGYYVNESGGLSSLTGYSIDYTLLGRYLETYSSTSDYTIHILNLNNLNDAHWVEHARASSQPQYVTDMRNLGIRGNKTIFYDPTAFAPSFEAEVLNPLTMNSTEIALFLIPRLIEIIEVIIIGSPYSIDYFAMEESIHVAQILIGNSSNDDLFDDAKDSLESTAGGVEGFDIVVKNLLPYFRVKTSYKKVLLDSDTTLATYLDTIEQTVNGSPFIEVNEAFAEKMKNLIRGSSAYDEYPRGYYYMVLLMADSYDREYIFNTENGTRSYQTGEIGVGIYNLKDWYTNINKNRIKVLQLSLQLFGKMIGITNLDRKFTSQIESVMSSNGVSNSWQLLFTAFEKDSLARRISGLYNYTAMLGIQNFRSNLRNSFFRWIDRSPLDRAEVKLIEANTAYYNGEYLKAATLFVEGFNLWEDARADIIQKRNAFYNTIDLIGIFIIFGIVIYLLKTSTLDRDEFFEKIRKYRGQRRQKLSK